MSLDLEALYFLDVDIAYAMTFFVCQQWRASVLISGGRILEQSEECPWKSCPQLHIDRIKKLALLIQKNWHCRCVGC